MDLRGLKQLSPEAASHLLESSGGLRYGRAVVLAELLRHEAAISEAMGADALLSRLHAFCLLADTLALEDQAVYRPKLNELAAQLRDCSSHPYLKAKLAVYDARPNT